MTKVLKVFVCGLILLTGISAVNAEEKETALEEIVVTATRTEKEVSEAPASVSVVTKEDIEKRNIRNIDEALNATPGVFNKRDKGHMTTGANILLRGIPGGQRTLILLDGITLNDDWSGGQGRPFAGLPPEIVERIEVVKGPFSSLYGGYAMGGVVNIITKMPEKREFVLKTGYGSSLDRGEAMDDLRKFYLSYGDKFKDKLSLFLSYGYKATNGYPSDFNVQSSKPTAGITGWSYTTDNQGNTRYLIGDKGDNGCWNDSITFKAEYDFSKASKIKVSFMSPRFEYFYDDPHTYLKDTNGNEVWSYAGAGESSFLLGKSHVEERYYDLSYETEISIMKANLSLGFHDGKYWYTSADSNATLAGGPGKDEHRPYKGYYANLQFTLPLFEKHILAFGGSFRDARAETKKHNLSDWQVEGSKTDLYYISKGKARTYGLFVQDEIMILDNLTGYIGFRQDWWETYDGYANQVGTSGYPKTYDERDASSFSPKAAIVYKPLEKTTLRTSIGKAFRAPTIYDLYSTFTYIPTGSITEGNPNLKPETLTSWDIGIEQDLWKGAKVKAAYFENYMKDLIYLKSITPTRKERVNVGKAKGRGVEIEAEQRFDKWLRLFASFTYNNAKIKENNANPETAGKKLTDVPERMFNIGGDFEKGAFSASLTGRYVGKRYANDENKDTVNNVYTSYDPYFVTDAKVSYKFTKNATLSFSVDNIFDRDYFAYYKTPGRSWFGEITLRF